VRLDGFNSRICMLSQLKPVVHCRAPFFAVSIAPVHLYVWKICAKSTRKPTDCRKLKQLNSFSRNKVDDRT